MRKLSKLAQDNLVVDLLCAIETMDSDEFESKFNMLDIDHQIEVDEGVRNFADGAVGCDWWDCDE